MVTFAITTFVQNNVLTPAAIQIVLVLTSLLMVTRFVLDALRHRSGGKKMKVFLHTLDVVTLSMTQYSLGIMQRPSATNSYYQVWAVLLVTLRYSVKIGRPAGIAVKQTPLVDLMSSFWAANILRSQARMVLKVPGWMLWSVNSVRIIHGFVSSEHATDSHRDNMRLLTDYMRHEHKAGKIDFDPRTMDGYTYLVLGEAKKKRRRKEKEDHTAATVQDADGEEAIESIKRLMLALQNDDKELITLEKIWSHRGTRGHGGCLCDPPAAGLFSDDVIDDRLKDLCLSFALYKLLRRRFFNLGIHEAKLAKTRRLFIEGILGGPGNINSVSERAFRVSEVEVAFLNDFFNSRHAIIFAKGFPFLRLFLSILLIGGIAGMAVGIHLFSKSSMEGEVRHGVVFTWILLSLLGAKEIWEITTYIFSDWTKVLLLCKYVEQPWWLRSSVATTLVRVLCSCRLLKTWHGKVGQFNLFGSSSRRPPLFCRRWPRPPSFVHLPQQVKNALVTSLRHGHEDGLQYGWRRLDDYLEVAFRRANVSPELEDSVKEAVKGLKDDVHILLVWHIATSYCALHSGMGVDIQTTARTLSEYCAYVLTLIPPMVPGNSLMARNVFLQVYREKNRFLGHNEVGTSSKPRSEQSVNSKEEYGNRDDTILFKGLNLGFRLHNDAEGNMRWKLLSEFWAGFVLYLASSIGAHQHKIFLGRGGELMTHLWAMLSHAGYMGDTTHGESPDLTVLAPRVVDPGIGN